MNEKIVKHNSGRLSQWRRAPGPAIHELAAYGGISGQECFGRDPIDRRMGPPRPEGGEARG